MEDEVSEETKAQLDEIRALVPRAQGLRDEEILVLIEGTRDLTEAKHALGEEVVV